MSIISVNPNGSSISGNEITVQYTFPTSGRTRIDSSINLSNSTYDLSSMCAIPYFDTAASPRNGSLFMVNLLKTGSTDQAEIAFFGPKYAGTSSNLAETGGSGVGELFKRFTYTTSLNNTINAKACYVESIHPTYPKRIFSIERQTVGQVARITDSGIDPRMSTLPNFTLEQSFPSSYIDMTTANPVNVLSFSNKILWVLESTSNFYFGTYEDMWSVDYSVDGTANLVSFITYGNQHGMRLPKLSGEVFITALKVTFTTHSSTHTDNDYVCYVTNKRIFFAGQVSGNIKYGHSFDGNSADFGNTPFNLSLNSVTISREESYGVGSDMSIYLRHGTRTFMLRPNITQVSFSTAEITPLIDTFNTLYPEENGYTILYNPFQFYPFNTGFGHGPVMDSRNGVIFVQGNTTKTIYKFRAGYQQTTGQTTSYFSTFAIYYACGSKSTHNKTTYPNRNGMTSPVIIPYFETADYQCLGLLDTVSKNKLSLVEPDPSFLFYWDDVTGLPYRVSDKHSTKEVGEGYTIIKRNAESTYDYYNSGFGISNMIQYSSEMILPSLAVPPIISSATINGNLLTMSVNNLYGKASNANNNADIDVNYKVGTGSWIDLVTNSTSFNVVDNGGENYTLTIGLNSIPNDTVQLQIVHVVDGASNVLEIPYSTIVEIFDDVFHLTPHINGYNSVTTINGTVSPTNTTLRPTLTNTYDLSAGTNAKLAPSSTGKFLGSVLYSQTTGNQTKLQYGQDADYNIDLDKDWELYFSFMASNGTPVGDLPIISYGNPSDGKSFAWRLFIASQTDSPLVIQVARGNDNWSEIRSEPPYAPNYTACTFFGSSVWNYFKVTYSRNDGKLRIYWAGSNTPTGGANIFNGSWTLNRTSTFDLRTITRVGDNSTFRLMLGYGHTDGMSGLKYSNLNVGEYVIRKHINSSGVIDPFRPPLISNVTISGNQMTINGENLLNIDNTTFIMQLNNQSLPTTSFVYSIDSKTQTQVVLNFTTIDTDIWNSSFSVKVLNEDGSDDYFVLRSQALPVITNITREDTTSSLSKFVITGQRFLNRQIVPSTVVSNILGIYGFSSITNTEPMVDVIGNTLVGKDLTAYGSPVNLSEQSLFMSNKVTQLNGSSGWYNDSVNYGLNGGTQFSVVMWLNPSVLDTTSTYTLFNKTIDGVYSTFLATYLNGKITVRLSNTTLNQHPVWIFDAIPSTTLWTNIIITFKKNAGVTMETDLNCYINGTKLIKSMTVTNGYLGTFVLNEVTNKFSIGFNRVTNSGFMTGMIDNFILLNTELNQSEVTAFANGGILKLYRDGADISQYIDSSLYNTSITDTEIKIDNNSNNMPLLDSAGYYKIQNSAGYSNEFYYNPNAYKFPFVVSCNDEGYQLCSTRDSLNTKSYTRKKTIRVVLNGNGNTISFSNITMIGNSNGFVIKNLQPMINNVYELYLEYYVGQRGTFNNNFTISITNSAGNTTTYSSPNFELDTVISKSKVEISHDGIYNTVTKLYYNDPSKNSITFRVKMLQPIEPIIPNALVLEPGYATMHSIQELVIVSGEPDMATYNTLTRLKDNQMYWNGTQDVSINGLTEYFVEYDIVVIKSGKIRIGRVYNSEIVDQTDSSAINNYLITEGLGSIILNCVIRNGDINIVEPEKPIIRAEVKDSLLPKFLTDKPFNDLFTKMAGRLLNQFYKKE